MPNPSRQQVSQDQIEALISTTIARLAGSGTIPLEPTNNVDAFLGLGDVLLASGFRAKSTLNAKVEAHEFPAPVKISEGRVAWLASEVRAWQAGRVRERDERLTARKAANQVAAAPAAQPTMITNAPTAA